MLASAPPEYICCFCSFDYYRRHIYLVFVCFVLLFENTPVAGQSSMQILWFTYLVAFSSVSLHFWLFDCAWSLFVLKLLKWLQRTQKVSSHRHTDLRHDCRTRTYSEEKQFSFHWEFYMAARQKQAVSLLSINQWLTQTLEIRRNDTWVLSARWTLLLKPRRFTLMLSEASNPLQAPLLSYQHPIHPS